MNIKNTFEYLDGLNIPYKKLKDPTNESISGKKTCDALGYLPSQVFKTVMIETAKKQYPIAVLMLPANRKPDLMKINSILGKKCVLAGKRNGFCEHEKGFFSPFFSEPMKVYLDESAYSYKNIVVNSGGIGNYIEISVEDLTAATGCIRADLSGDYSVELFGRNHSLPIGSFVGMYEIVSVLSITPLEIIYKAKDISGNMVDICEFFPRFRGFYASRSSNGEEVCWLEYTNDMIPRFSFADHTAKDAYYQWYTHAYHRINKHNLIEYNNTFYIISAPMCGKPFSELIRDNIHVTWDILKTAVFPLANEIKNNNYSYDSIRPDTVYLDINTGKASLRTYAVPTNIFRRSAGIQFMYDTNYDPFIIDCSKNSPDEVALFRVICYMLLGPKSFWTGEKAVMFDELCCYMSSEEANMILEKAFLNN